MDNDKKMILDEIKYYLIEINDKLKDLEERLKGKRNIRENKYWDRCGECKKLVGKDDKGKCVRCDKNLCINCGILCDNCLEKN